VDIDEEDIGRVPPVKLVQPPVVTTTELVPEPEKPGDSSKLGFCTIDCVGRRVDPHTEKTCVTKRNRVRIRNAKDGGDN
jgi:hypothetical protein